MNAAPATVDARAHEARRQQALLDASLHGRGEALAALAREAGARLARGVDAYRLNLDAAAERALLATYPVLQQLIGAESFALLARAYLRACVPTRGDLAWLGEPLPGFIESSASLADEPFLADVARLEWHLSRAEVAADVEFDAASLALLGEHDPAQLALELRPGSAVLSSRWPVASIWHAHRTAGEPHFEGVRAALAEGRGEHLLVVRRGWRAEVVTLDAGEAAFSAALVAGATLQSALDAALAVTDHHFNFAAWLQRALTEGWLWRARVDPTESTP